MLIVGAVITAKVVAGVCVAYLGLALVLGGVTWAVERWL